MSFPKATVADADLDGRRVLLRSDLNVPLDGGRVRDDTRIRASLATLQALRDGGASVTVVSHLGRPKDRDPELSMAPVARRLGMLLGEDVAFSPEVVGEAAMAASHGLDPGEVMVLENSRYEPGETKNDPELSAALARMGDIYVNDAFGSAHRAHATTEGVARELPAYAGLLLEREVTELTAVRDDPERPLVVILGGSKVTDKIGVITRFLDAAEKILIGGAMCFSFFRAQGHGIGNSLVDDESVEAAREVLERLDGAGAELMLPTDLVAGREFDAGTETREIEGTDVPDGWMGLDVGPQTVSAYSEAIGSAGTVLWNGPMGAFEMKPFAAGTRGVAEAVAKAGGHTVIGGGDSAAALVEFGLDDDVDWLSTGGGASLELLEGKSLPGVEALLDRDQVQA